MKLVYEAANPIEARLLVDHLAEHGVHAIVQGEYLLGAVGELPALQYPRVLITDDDLYAHATNLVRRFNREATERAAQPDWICPHCGETNTGGFDRCWSCNRVPDESAGD
ncbi:MAG: DUF2007 domain-containing protein [Chromatiales bacterium]|nr:DUF2007 domain-containing protein [Chromatiales bacterium]